MLRRHVLKHLLAGAGLFLWGLATKVQAATWFVRAFEASRTSEVMAALQATAVPLSAEIVIDAPQKAENGAVVQVEVALPAAAGSVRSLRLLADANPTPLVASVEFSSQVLPRMVTRIKMAQSGDLIALLEQADGRLIQQRRAVIVLEDGCANSEHEEPFSNSMKIRARPLADGPLGKQVTELKIIILHPMRTGRSKNDDGQRVPAHFMQTMQVVLAGRVLIDVQTGTAISRNPYFTFYLQGVAAGDVITVNWQDNRGLEGHGQVTVGG